VQALDAVRRAGASRIRYNILPKAAAEKTDGSVYPTVLMLPERAMPDFL
jgi:hypothetical protein